MIINRVSAIHICMLLIVNAKKIKFRYKNLANCVVDYKFYLLCSTLDLHMNIDLPRVICNHDTPSKRFSDLYCTLL